MLWILYYSYIVILLNSIIYCIGSEVKCRKYVFLKFISSVIFNYFYHAVG